MSDDKMTDAEFASKVGWKNGVIDALDDGLRSRDLANQDGELARVWRELEQACASLEPLEAKAQELVDGLLSADND